LDVPVVAADMTSVARQSTAYLIESGHSRIAFISTLEIEGPYRHGMELASSQITERIEGMNQALLAAGLDPCEELVRLSAGNAESIKAIARELLLLPEPATALIASDGLVALGVVEAIQELGLQIPQDVSFLMYDDFPWTKLTTPPLTVISQPVYDIGASAAEALIRLIKQPGKVLELPVFQATLKHRGSVGAPESERKRKRESAAAAS
jgi:LacI family transcriptional regulator